MAPTQPALAPTVDRRPLALRATSALIAVVLALWAADLWCFLTWSGKNTLPPAFRELFDLTSEESIGTWFSTGLLAALGLTGLFLARATRRPAWGIVGAFFLYLSMDDATRFHERVGWVTESWAPSDAAFAWVQLLGPLYAVLGLLSYFVYRPHLRRRLARHLVVLAGFGVQGVALVFEVFEKHVVAEGALWRGFIVSRYLRSIEEACELLGPALLLGAALAILEDPRRGLKNRQQDKADWLAA